jgi:putative ABC transport system substrate-binding protein
MKRRDFITLFGGAAAAWPLVARAQQAAMPVIGFINGGSIESQARGLAAFRQGMGETGYIENHNVKVEYRWAEGRYDRLSGMAADLVRRQVIVIAATSTPAALAGKAATAVVPIVFETAGDPITLGLVGNWNRPGGNVTGVTRLGTELGSKRLGLLHDAIPTAKIIASLVDPDFPNADAELRDTQEAAGARGLQIHILKARTEGEIDSAFAALPSLQAGALIVGSSELFTRRRETLVALAAHRAIPALYPWREAAVTGGLMSYGAKRWSRFPGQNGGLAKVVSGFDYAASFSCSLSIA